MVPSLNQTLSKIRRAPYLPRPGTVKRKKQPRANRRVSSRIVARAVAAEVTRRKLFFAPSFASLCRRLPFLNSSANRALAKSNFTSRRHSCNALGRYAESQEIFFAACPPLFAGRLRDDCHHQPHSEPLAPQRQRAILLWCRVEQPPEKPD